MGHPVFVSRQKPIAFFQPPAILNSNASLRLKKTLKTGTDTQITQCPVSSRSVRQQVLEFPESPVGIRTLSSVRGVPAGFLRGPLFLRTGDGRRIGPVAPEHAQSNLVQACDAELGFAPTVPATRRRDGRVQRHHDPAEVCFRSRLLTGKPSIWF